MLKYVGGVDMSFSKEDSSVACACLVVLELPSLRVVHHEFSLLCLHVPYLPVFLAFREAPVLLKILQNMRDDQHPLYPQVLMVDGNGILHPRGFGLACHLGVLAHLPTIGVGKNGAIETVSIGELEVVMRSSKLTTISQKAKSQKSPTSGRGKWMVVATVAWFLSVSVVYMVVKTPKVIVEVKELKLDISNDGGTKPNLYVKLNVIPILVHLIESRMITDNSSNLSVAMLQLCVPLLSHPQMSGE